MDNIYKIILEETLAGYWDWNIRDNKEYLSPSFKAMFGYEDHELDNNPETWKKLIFKEDLELKLYNYKEHLRTKGVVPYRHEARYIHKNGSTVWVLSSGRVIEWDGENPVRMVGCNIDITAQKNAEEKLQSTQRFLLQTNEVAKAGGWEMDFIKGELLWTDITRRIHEVEDTFQPVVEKGISFYKKGYSRDRISEVFEKLVTKGEPFNEELQIVTLSGKEKWIRTLGKADFLNGKCIRAYGTFQDIDEWKKIQDEFLESELRFRESFENSAIGMALVSLDGKWLQVNKQACEITGYSKDELLRKTFQDITHPDDLHADLNHVQELLEGKASKYQMEKRYFQKLGNVVWVLLSVSLIRKADGTPLHFVSQLEDITKRKVAEEQLQNVNNELTTLFDSFTHVSVIATDYNGVIKHFSRGSEQLLGYDAEEMIDKETPAIIHIREEVIARGIELSAEFERNIEGFEVFVTHAKAGKYESREWTYVKKDGRKFPVQLVVTSIRGADGSITGFLGIATDISEIKQTEEQLRNTIDIVSEQNKRLFNFAHIVSHNLRSHAGNLSLLLQLYDEAIDHSEKQQLLEHLNSVSTNLNDTIQHLNEVVSIQTNINQQRKRIDLHEYVENAIKTLVGEINHTSTTIENNVEKGTIVYYNEAYMESILLNMVSNGIKYRSRDRAPKVVLTAYSTNGRTVIEVSDNGIGIDMERHGNKLFGMYKTFHGNEDAKGIGLFITKNQVEAMGGKIIVSSEPGIGTTFKIYLS